MGLGQLLSVGKSLKDPGDGARKFQLKPGSLPKFAPAKRAISLKPAAGGAANNHGLLFDARTMKQLENKQGKKTETMALVQPAMPTPAEAQPSGTFKRLIQWVTGRKDRRDAAVAIQTEWALERVTVVRNDLSETDLEIVVGNQPAAQKKSPTLRRHIFAGPGMAGRVWRRVRGRFRSNSVSPFENAGKQ
jgi:hypothetical protein